MILTLMQIVLMGMVLTYLGHCRAGHGKRNAATWESLLLRLRADWSPRELNDRFLWKDGLTRNGQPATTETIWQLLEGPKGLWAIYQNARVFLEIADFATHCAPAPGALSVDPILLATLRSDAMQIRLCVLMALSQYAISHATAGVRVNAYRAAELYSAMAARTTQLLQTHAAQILPDFVAAL